MISIYIFCLFFAVGNSAALCRDTSDFCYPTFGESGWYPNWCVPERAYVLDACHYMCADCYLEVYDDAVLYFNFNENGTTYYDVTATVAAADGTGVSPSEGRVSMQATLDPLAGQSCISLGDFAGTCISDPSLCANGFTIAFFFDHGIPPGGTDDDISYLSTGAHDGSTGVYFHYKGDDDDFIFTVNTGAEKCSAIIDLTEMTKDEKFVTHLAFTWKTLLTAYVNGQIVQSNPAELPLIVTDTNSEFTIGCKNTAPPQAEFMKIDELAVWEREITTEEIALISDAVVIGSSTVPGVSAATQLQIMLSIANGTANFNTTIQILTTLSEFVSGRPLKGSDVNIALEILSSISLDDLDPPLTSTQVPLVTESLVNFVDVLVSGTNVDAWKSATQGYNARLLITMDNMTESLSKPLANDSDPKILSQVRNNIELEIQTKANLVDNTIVSNNDDNRLTLRAAPTQQEHTLVHIVYKGFQKAFSTNTDVTVPTEKPVTKEYFQVRSDIICATVYPPLPQTDGLVDLHFKISRPKNTNSTAVCTFWDDRNPNIDGFWSSQGCSTQEISDSLIQCFCNHLTSFAILLQVVEFEISETDRQALELITYIGCALSIVGAILTVLTYIVLRIFTDRVLIHMNLAVAIIGAQITLLIEESVPRGSSGCIAVTIMLYYFNMSIFCWMLVEGIQMFLQIVVVFTSESRMNIFYGVGWGVPGGIVIIAMVALKDKIGKQPVCWLSPADNSIWAFAVPALAIICTNLVILVLVMRVLIKLCAANEDSKLKCVKTAIKASILLTPILGCSWLFGVLAVSSQTVVFQYIFAATNSIQGMLLFICHCAINTEVREVFFRRKSLWELSRYLGAQSRVEPVFIQTASSSMKSKPGSAGSQERTPPDHKPEEPDWAEPKPGRGWVDRDPYKRHSDFSTSTRLSGRGSEDRGSPPGYMTRNSLTSQRRPSNFAWTPESHRSGSNGMFNDARNQRGHHGNTWQHNPNTPISQRKSPPLNRSPDMPDKTSKYTNDLIFI